MIRISLFFDHHKRTPKGEDGPVEVRVTVNKKPYYINTGVKVTQDRLVGNCIRDVRVKGADGIVRTTEDADTLNERLTTIVRLVENEVNRCLDERRPLDVAEIRRKVYDLEVLNDDDAPTLVAWIKEQIPMLNVVKNTRQKYVTLCRRLTEFGQITRWEHLSVEAIYKWDAWLRVQDNELTTNQKAAGVEQAKLGDKAVESYHKGLRAMLNRALKMGKITANPYDRLRGEFVSKRRDVVDYLTEEQMQKVMEITPVPGSQVAMARDLFIFQMFTGLGYADTQIFDLSQYREVDGKWQFIGKRVKTGVPYVSMLLPPVVEVLKRNGWRVPKMNNQRYNQMLKAIGMVIGIERLHSHMGRHTFATWMLSNGSKIENVSKMLGHTDIKMTQRYAEVLAKDVYDDFAMVEKKLKKKKKGDQ
jgi:integrase